MVCFYVNAFDAKLNFCHTIEIFMCASQWDTVNCNKFDAWNICITSFTISIRHYHNFLKLALNAFCKQTLHMLPDLRVLRDTSNSYGDQKLYEARVVTLEYAYLVKFSVITNSPCPACLLL